MIIIILIVLVFPLHMKNATADILWGTYDLSDCREEHGPRLPQKPRKDGKIIVDDVIHKCGGRRKLSKEERNWDKARSWRGWLRFVYPSSSDDIVCKYEKDRLICDLPFPEEEYKTRKGKLEEYTERIKEGIKESSDPDEIKEEDLKNLEKFEKKELERIEKIKNAKQEKMEEIRKENPDINESELRKIIRIVGEEINKKVRLEVLNDEKEQLEKMPRMPDKIRKEQLDKVEAEKKQILLWLEKNAEGKRNMHQNDIIRIKDVNEKADSDKKTGKNGTVPEKK